jgi:hypothetical protein
MNPLVIEYVLAGKQRGYNFTSPTSGYDDDTLKRIWRSAMPRGQGWADYVGARSLKCFPLDERRMALAEVSVTDQSDESDRRGIRRAVVHVFYGEDCAAFLRRWLKQYPPDLHASLDRLPTPSQWASIVGRVLPLLGKRDQQLILTTPYDARRWLLMEGMIIKLALALQVGIPRTSSVVPFTTLALDAREEMKLVAVPHGKSTLPEKAEPLKIDLIK